MLEQDACRRVGCRCGAPCQLESGTDLRVELENVQGATVRLGHGRGQNADTESEGGELGDHWQGTCLEDDPRFESRLSAGGIQGATHAGASREADERLVAQRIDRNRPTCCLWVVFVHHRRQGVVEQDSGVDAEQGAAG